MDNDYLRYEKTLGCLSMVAIGDALGMPAHDMTPEQIKVRFDGPIRDFRPPFADSRVHAQLSTGQVTDDTHLTLAMAKACIDHPGGLSPAVAARYTAETVRRAFGQELGTLYGPSTRNAVDLIEQGRDPVAAGRAEKHPMMGASNGAAMKIAAAGLIHPGDVAGAVSDAVNISLPTHPTQTAIAAAGAIAAGVAEAMSPDASVYTVVQATLAGAYEGEQLGRQQGRTVPLPSVAERIKLAVELTLRSQSAEEACERFGALIGTGLAAYESIPTAIGIFLACEGDPAACVLAGANIGFDTDTIASMAGALSGALRGFSAVPPQWFDVIEVVNHLELKTIARELAQVPTHRSQGSKP